MTASKHQPSRYTAASPRRLWSDATIDAMLDEIARIQKCVAGLMAAGDGLTGAMPSEKDWHDARTRWDKAKAATMVQEQKGG